MKLYYEPTVRLVVKPQVDYDGLSGFMNDHDIAWVTDAADFGDMIPEVAGRLCYMSFGKPRPGGNKAYLKHIKEVGHGSVLEHPTWSFIFTGISRTLTHELVRHRAGWAYSQLSQRYVDESVAEFVVPLDLHDEVRQAEMLLREHADDKVNAFGCPSDGADTVFGRLGSLTQVEGALSNITYTYWKHPGEPTYVGLEWLRSVLRGNLAYQRLSNYLLEKLFKADYQGFLSHPTNAGVGQDEWLKSRPTDYRTTVRKAARSAARSVLPNATETKIFVTANARAWRHFTEMRCAGPAEAEIRRLTEKVLLILQKEAPNLFGDYTLHELPDGTREARTDYRKV